MVEENLKYPKVTVAVLVINKNGKFLLVRGERFNKLLHIPGGHIEWGEKMIDTCKREIKEEIGINIYDLEFLRPLELIFHGPYDKNRHVIPLVFIAKTNDDENAVKLEPVEAFEFAWQTAEEFIKRDDVEPITKETLTIYLNQQKDKQLCVEYKANWQRALADYQNLLKETAKRRQEWVEMSELEVLEEFIPVYDNFKKAFSVKEQGVRSKEQESWRLGIGHIYKQFGEILKQHKIEEIKTVGEKFDPSAHESVGEEEVEGKQHGEIVREIDGGYKMNGRVIKAARVIIVK